MHAAFHAVVVVVSCARVTSVVLLLGAIEDFFFVSVVIDELSAVSSFSLDHVVASASSVVSGSSISLLRLRSSSCS